LTHRQDPERRKTRFLAPFPRKPLIRLKSGSRIAIFCTFLHANGNKWALSAVFRAGLEGIAFRAESGLPSEFNRGFVDAVADRVATRGDSLPANLMPNIAVVQTLAAATD